MKDFFLNEKPVMALVTIHQNEGEIHGGQLSREIDAPYDHTIKMLSQMEENGLVALSDANGQNGRKAVELTQEGREYSSHFLNLLDSFKSNGNLNTKVPWESSN